MLPQMRKVLKLLCHCGLRFQMMSGLNAPTKFSRVSTVKAKTWKHLSVFSWIIGLFGLFWYSHFDSTAYNCWGLSTFNPCYYLHILGHCQTLMRDSHKLAIIIWNLARPQTEPKSSCMYWLGIQVVMEEAMVTFHSPPILEPGNEDPGFSLLFLSLHIIVYIVIYTSFTRILNRY